MLVSKEFVEAQLEEATRLPKKPFKYNVDGKTFDTFSAAQVYAMRRYGIEYTKDASKYIKVEFKK
jgi:hypothetical protein